MSLNDLLNLSEAAFVAAVVAVLIIVAGAVASIIAAGIIAVTKYRAVAKAALWGVIALVSCVVLWFAANRLLDESPDPNRETFLVSSSDQLPDERNIAIGILGLTAPSGQDFVQYGAKLKSLEMANAQSLGYGNMLWGNLLWGPKTLQPESEGIWCWQFQVDSGIINCIPLEEVSAIFMQNSELLARYRDLHRLGAYSSTWWGGNPAYLEVTRLAVAELRLDLIRNQHESAYRKWRDQVLLVRTTLRGPDTWIGKAVAMVATGYTLRELENILQADPRLAKQHAAELKNLLRPEGMGGFNLEGVLRAEYLSLKDALDSPQRQMRVWGSDEPPSYLIQKDRILNRYYYFARDYAAILRLPWSQIEKEVVRWRESFAYPSGWDFAVDPLGSLFFSLYIEDQLKVWKVRALVISMNEIDGTLKLSTLLVRIINEDVADAAISDFLSSVGPELYDPFSGGPMRWDPKQRRIYFPNPVDPSRRDISLRVPPKRVAKPMAVPSVTEGAASVSPK